MEQQFEEFKNNLTPSPIMEMSTEQREHIVTLLEAGILPREIYIDYNIPLEWAIQVQSEQVVVASEPIVNEI